MVKVQMRIARSLVTVILLTLFQSVIAPIFAPLTTLPVADAATFDSTNMIVQMDVNLPNTFEYASTRIWDQLRRSDAIENTQLTFTSTGGGYVTFANGANASTNIATFSSPITPYLDATNSTTKKNLSMFTWVYPTGDGVIIDEIGGDNSIASPVWHDSHIEMVAGSLKFRVWGVSAITSSIATPLNNWYYIGYTYDATAQVLKAYVNGQIAGTVTGAVRSVPWEDAGAYGSYFSIGRGDGTHMGDGTGGDFRFGSLHIFKTPLTQATVQNNFEAQAARFGPNIAAPTDQTGYVNRSATFSTSACSAATSGSSTCTYQWQSSTDNGSTFTDIAGATGITYTTSLLTSASNGMKFRVIAYDPGGTTTAPDIFNYSTAATLAVMTLPGSDTDTALLLNGSNQYGEVSDITDSPVDITGNMTLQAWVYLKTDCVSDQAVVAKLNSYMLYCGSNGVWKYVFDADGASWAGIDSAVKVIKNEWHHIAYVKTGTTLVIYVDGVVAQTITGVQSTQSPNNGAFIVGRYGSVSHFNGELDEVRVYNTARTQSQIQSDMHAYGPATDSALVAYYDFNEGSGTTLYNRKQGATAATDLAIYASPTWTDIKSVVSDGPYTTVTFDRTYITSSGGWKAPTGVIRLAAVVVAGGGGGNGETDFTGWLGGGGGAGGYQFINTTVTANSTQALVVGQGGRRGIDTASQDLTVGVPTSGQDSTFGSFTSIGGGYGGGRSHSGARGAAGAGGGSGGGGGTYSGTGGAATAGQGNSGGASSASCCSAGGGGGAGGAGGSASGTTGGNAGNGLLNPFYTSGSNLQYLAGGGAAGGSVANGVAGSLGGVAWKTSAPANSGSGGGGGGGGTTHYPGGYGGSGVIILRWITASKPIFTQPTGDTTTAGLTDTMTVSANPISPLTRNYQWQISTDTGTSWSNATTGSGATTYIYTTATLETTTSGARYQYRVIVTDSDTAGLFIVDTSTSVYLIINARITYAGTYTAQKYGATHQDTFTVTNGTGNKTFTYSPNNRSGISWSSPFTNSAVLTIATTLSPGTYLETITATDTKGAQTSLALSILITKADTITVTALARSDTYTGSALTFNPSFTVVGLKNSDTVTPISYNYAGSDNAGTAYGSSSSKPMNAGSYSITPVTPASLTDSYTAVVVETATLTINRATRSVTIGTKPTAMQFGSTSALVATANAGGSDGTLSYSSLSTDTCTVSAANLQARKSSGTCSFTASISRGNNYESATATTATATLSKADTLTVTVNAITPVTYTGSPAAVSPTVTVTGLKLTNAVGSTPVTINYGSIGTLGSTCATGGTCVVGDTGPGGGKVFYVASSQQSWGRYLEAAPSNWSGGLDTSYRAKWCGASPSIDSTIFGTLPDGIGQGYANTYSMTQCAAGAIWTARTFTGGGLNDWYLPTGAELALMATSTNRVLLSLIDGTSSGYWGYWGSNENSDGTIGSLVTGHWGIGATNKNESTHNYIRPIRAFSAGNAVTSLSTQIPTQVDTYTVQASSLTLSSGSLNDYLGVTYVDGSLRINRAQQSPLSIAQFGAYLGTPYRIIIFGGSGTGALTETVTAGTANNCLISGDTLTASTQGTCQVFATKAQDRNYETATASAMVYFLLFVAAQPAPAPSSGPGIAITGATAITVSGGAPAITSVGASGDFTYPVAISGSGFASDAAANTTIKFWRNALVSSPDFIIKSDGLIWSKQPFGATTGRVLVTNSLGSAVSPEPFTPILMITI